MAGHRPFAGIEALQEQLEGYAGRSPQPMELRSGVPRTAHPVSFDQKASSPAYRVGGMSRQTWSSSTRWPARSCR